LPSRSRRQYPSRQLDVRLASTPGSNCERERRLSPVVGTGVDPVTSCLLRTPELQTPIGSHVRSGSLQNILVGLHMCMIPPPFGTHLASPCTALREATVVQLRRNVHWRSDLIVMGAHGDREGSLIRIEIPGAEMSVDVTSAPAVVEAPKFDLVSFWFRPTPTSVLARRSAPVLPSASPRVLRGLQRRPSNGIGPPSP